MADLVGEIPSLSDFVGEAAFCILASTLDGEPSALFLLGDACTLIIFALR